MRYDITDKSTSATVAKRPRLGGHMETFNSGSSQLMPALDLHHYPPYSTNDVKDNRPQIFSNQCIGQLGMCKTLLSWYLGDEWLPIAIETSFDKTRNLSCSALRPFTCLKSGRIAPLRQLSDSKGQEPNSCTLVRDTNKRTGWGCNLYIETLTGRQVDSCQGGGGGGEGGWAN